MVNVIEELATIRDYVRHGVSKFNKENLSYSHGTDNAFDEAVYLIFDLLDLPIEKLETFLDANLTELERESVVDIIDKRIKTRKPTPYLTNKLYIKEHCFFVDERVNIPRTFLAELLMSDLIGGKDFNLIDEPREIKSVLDLCSGSSFLSIIASEIFPDAKIDCVDVSKDALEVAKVNLKNYKLENRITLNQGDLYEPVQGKKYDLIVANPPFLSSSDLRYMPSEYSHEPKRAIEAGAEGITIIKHIIDNASDYLTENGMLLCEVGTAKEELEKAYPGLDFMWFDVEHNKHHAFWLTYDELLF